MKTNSLLLGVAAALIANAPLAGQTADPPSAPGGDAYRIELLLVPAESRLEGRVQLRFRNHTAHSLAALRLRLDPNLSAKQSLEIVSVADGAGAALPWSYQSLTFAAMRSDRGAVEIRLAQPLAPAAATTVALAYRSRGNHAGPDMIVLQDDPFTSLDAWYPKAMTPAGAGWSIDDDRLADYEVTLKYPAPFVFGSSGTRLAETTPDGQRETRWQAGRVRGFSAIGSPQWQRHERRGAGRELGVCLPAEAAAWADRLLDATADAIAYYEKTYAPLPARHLDIICPGSLGDPAHGSSAGCNLITIFLGGALEQQFRFLVAHEVAHQYFGVSVGFPRDSIGWVPVGLGLMMDEDCARTRGFDATFGPTMMRDFYLRAERMGFDTTLSQSVQVPLQCPPPWRGGWNMSLAHGKAYAVCALLRDLLGAEKFRGVVQTLLRKHAGAQIREADLLAACETAWSGRLDWFARDWIDGRATFDYAIRSVESTDAGCEVTVARAGTGSFPIWVEVTTERGELLRQRMDRTRAEEILRFRTTGLVKAVRVNPDGVYPDLDSSTDVWPAPAKAPGRN